MSKKQLKKEIEKYEKSIKFQDEEISILKAFSLGVNKVVVQRKKAKERKKL